MCAADSEVGRWSFDSLEPQGWDCRVDRAAKSDLTTKFAPLTDRKCGKCHNVAEERIMLKHLHDFAVDLLLPYYGTCQFSVFLTQLSRPVPPLQKQSHSNTEAARSNATGRARHHVCLHAQLW